MDTRIDSSRTIAQVPSTLEPKRLHSVAKEDEATRVLADPKKEKLESAGVDKEKDKNKDQVPNKEELANAVTHINSVFQDEKRSIQFNVDEDSDRTVIKVVDSKTGEVIRQIPSEDVLDISRRLSSQMKEKDDVTGMLLTGQA